MLSKVVNKAHLSGGDMELRQLEYFLLAVELKSLSRAAIAAEVAQPVLSRQIRMLEHDLGVRLFHRNGRGVTPNADGLFFYKKIKVILRNIDRSVAELRDKQNQAIGKITLGVPPHIGPGLIARLVDEFSYRYPKAMLSIKEGFSKHIVEWLETGRIDVGLMYDPKAYRYIRSEKVFEESLFLVCPPCRKEESKASINLKEACQFKFIFPNRPSLLLEKIDQAFNKIKKETPVHLSVDSFSAIKTLVRNKKGYSILGYAAIYEEVSRGELCAILIEDPEIKRDLVISLPAKGVLTFATKKLISLIKELIAYEVRIGRWHGIVVEDKLIEHERPKATDEVARQAVLTVTEVKG